MPSAIKTGFYVLKINDFQFLTPGASAFAGIETQKENTAFIQNG